MLNKAHFLDIKKCAFKSDLSGRDFKWYGTITHSHKYTCKTGSFLILYKTLSLIMFSLFSNRSKDRHKNTSEVTFWHKLNCRRTDGCPWELFVKESIFKIKKKITETFWRIATAHFTFTDSCLNLNKRVTDQRQSFCEIEFLAQIRNCEWFPRKTEDASWHLLQK